MKIKQEDIDNLKQQDRIEYFLRLKRLEDYWGYNFGEIDCNHLFIWIIIGLLILLIGINLGGDNLIEFKKLSKISFTIGMILVGLDLIGSIVNRFIFLRESDKLNRKFFKLENK